MTSDNRFHLCVRNYLNIPAICESAYEASIIKLDTVCITAGRVREYLPGKDFNILRNIIILYTTMHRCLCAGTEAREHANRPRLAGAAEHQIFLPRKGARTNCVNRNARSAFALVPFSGTSFCALNVDRREVFSANRGSRLRTITGVPAVVRSLHLHSRIIPRIARPGTLQSSSEAVQLG